MSTQSSNSGKRNMYRKAEQRWAMYTYLYNSIIFYTYLIYPDLIHSYPTYPHFSIYFGSWNAKPSCISMASASPGSSSSSCCSSKVLSVCGRMATTNCSKTSPWWKHGMLQTTTNHGLNHGLAAGIAMDLLQDLEKLGAAEAIFWIWGCICRTTTEDACFFFFCCTWSIQRPSSFDDGLHGFHDFGCESSKVCHCPAATSGALSLHLQSLDWLYSKP